jgi:hypothetical protein
VTLLTVTGCASYRGELAKILEANENVASVDWSGGGYSDARWEMLVTPEQGLSDRQLTDVANAIEADLAAWSGPRPEVLELELGRIDLSLARHQGSVDQLFALWRQLTDDARVVDGVAGSDLNRADGANLRAETADAFAVAIDYAATPGGLLVTDEDPESQKWSYYIAVDADCAEATDELALFEEAFAAPMAGGEITHLSVNPCRESTIDTLSKEGVVALARTSAPLLAFDDGVSVNLSYSTVEEDTGRGREWSVALERFSPEVGDLLEVLYASNAVVACELLTSNTLRVSLAEGESAQPIEQLIGDSGLEFSTVLVGSDL